MYVTCLEFTPNLQNKSKMDAVSQIQLHGSVKARSRMLKIVRVIVIEYSERWKTCSR